VTVLTATATTSGGGDYAGYQEGLTATSIKGTSL
jgi:hypothetical protein